MQLTVITVGRPAGLMADAIAEFETRAARYWKLDIDVVAPQKATRNRPVTDIRAAEAERIRAAVPAGAEIVAVTRTGSAWSSVDLARYISDLAVAGAPGAAFVIGGAYGLDRQFLRDAHRQLSLSAMTLPHDLARLLLAEQIYRAGTIARGEPYHKG
ncbi:MAG: 23S rRNA (pseudouridine(1915)-N(3))-methyltransferase RlmH [Gemmatimonadota bacterium]